MTVNITLALWSVNYHTISSCLRGLLFGISL